MSAGYFNQHKNRSNKGESKLNYVVGSQVTETFTSEFDIERLLINSYLTRD